MSARARRTALLAALPLALAGAVLTAGPALADPVPVSNDQDYSAEAVTLVDNQYWTLGLSWSPLDGWTVSASGPGGHDQAITQALADSQVRVQGQGKHVVLPRTQITQDGRSTWVAATFDAAGGALSKSADRYSPQVCGSALRQSSVTRGATATVTMFDTDFVVQPAKPDDPFVGGTIVVDRSTGQQPC